MTKLLDRFNKNSFFELLTVFYQAYDDTSNPFYDGAIRGALRLEDFVCIEQLESRLISLEAILNRCTKKYELSKSFQYYFDDLENCKFRKEDFDFEEYWKCLGEICVLNYICHII